jgi:CyaY protein
MNDTEYRALAEAFYTALEWAIDELVEQQDVALDYENTGGVLTIFCEDTDTQVIVSRQQATHQIWVAAKSGGFHCMYDETQQWRCTTTQETLAELLSRACSEQSSKPIHFMNLG